jgi:hypothetical protein
MADYIQNKTAISKILKLKSNSYIYHANLKR